MSEERFQREGFHRCFVCTYPIIGEVVWTDDQQPAHNVCYLEAKIAGLATIVRNLETKVAELSETYIDENGTVWTPPTAWAYAQACKALQKCKEKQSEDNQST